MELFPVKVNCLLQLFFFMSLSGVVVFVLNTFCENLLYSWNFKKKIVSHSVFCSFCAYILLILFVFFVVLFLKLKHGTDQVFPMLIFSLHVFTSYFQ